jgi:predicted NUDIX family NTP pyrophosphohydrolase
MPKTSAGLLLHRKRGGTTEVFLVHPGGPFYARKDAGVWSIPKGEFLPGEDPLAAAQREFREETGMPIEGNFLALPVIKQKGGKWIYCWAVEADLDPATIKSNLFEMEWPPKSGQQTSFPEVDRGGWFTPEEARVRILESQLPLLEAFLNEEKGGVVKEGT